MTSKVQFTINTDEKQMLKAVLEDMGLDIATACKIFVKKVINTGSLPFEVSTKAMNEPSIIMTKANLKAYKKAKKELENGQSLSLDEIKKKYVNDI